MSNHAHLLLFSGPLGLPGFMRRLLAGYAVWFNRRHQRAGHLFQNRYKSIVCEEDQCLLELVRYIHLNPLRGNVVRNRETKSIEETIQRMGIKSGVSEKEVRSGSQRRVVSGARTKISCFLNREMGISKAEIAMHLGVGTSAIAMAIRRKYCDSKRY